MKFICGTYFKHQCRFQLLDYTDARTPTFSFKIDDDLENDFVFSIVWHSSRSGNLSEKVFTSWKWEEQKESPDLAIMKSIADHFAGAISTEDGTSTYLSVYSGSRNTFNIKY